MVPSIEPLVPRWAPVVQTRKGRTAKQMTAALHRETNDKFISTSPPMMKSRCLMGIRIPIVLVAIPARGTSKRPAHICAGP
jgi:hypothetical protein